MEKNRLFVMAIVLSVILVSCINKTSDEKKRINIVSSDSIVLPCLFEESESGKTYLLSVSLVDKKLDFIQNLLSYNYLKDSIGENDIFLEYTFRDESIYMSETIIDERSFISRYVPTEDKDFQVSTVITFFNMIQPQGCIETNFEWVNKGQLSSKDNNIEQKILSVYQKIEN